MLSNYESNGEFCFGNYAILFEKKGIKLWQKVCPFYFLFSHKFGDISHEKNLALGGSQAPIEVATKLDQCPVVAKPVSVLASLIAQNFPDSKK